MFLHQNKRAPSTGPFQARTSWLRLNYRENSTSDGAPLYPAPLPGAEPLLTRSGAARARPPPGAEQRPPGPAGGGGQDRPRPAHPAGASPGTPGKAGHPRGAGEGKAPQGTGDPPRTCSTSLGKRLSNHRDCIAVIPLSDRNSFLSIRCPLRAPTRGDTAPERPGHTDTVWRMKRGKPPIKPSRTFPGTRSRAARDCRHPNCPSERLSTSSDSSLRAASSFRV